VSSSHNRSGSADTPRRTADRQNDMLYEFIFEPAPRLRQHRRKVGFGSWD
jgi:hypothetical protein